LSRGKDSVDKRKDRNSMGLLKEQRRRTVTILFSALLLLFVFQRFGILLFGYSHISHPGIDEPVTGVLPCDLLDRNLRAPLYAYQYESRSGDTLMEGLLLVPFFKLLGRSIFSFKTFPLVSSLICLFCWIAFIKRYQGLWVAIIFAALYALPPPMFARLNLIGTLSSHHIINILIPIQLILLFRIMEGDKDKISLWLWLGLGFFSGLGTYAFYTYIIFNGMCLLFLFVFKWRSITFRRLFFFLGGLLIGFSLWIMRSLSSKAGGYYLALMVKNINFSLWSFVQAFGFNVPHSLGFGYPSREIGFIGILYSLAILFSIGVLTRTSLQNLSLKNIGREKTPLLQNLFITIFPPFFLTCFALSPIHIYPFEYWPNCGLFATFPPADALKYRWFHILFPFYFTIVALGIVNLFNVTSDKRTYKFFSVLVFIFLLLCGVAGNIKLYSKNNFGKIFYYKGYNYDQFSVRFILWDFPPRDEETARNITENYPVEHRGEAYRCFGTFVAKNLLKDSNREMKLEKYFKELPHRYLRDFIYGIVRVAPNITEKEFQPFTDILTKRYPGYFYENWGFVNLGYKYYSVFINQEILLKNIPSAEQWFFKNYVEQFKHEIESDGVRIGEEGLLNEINLIPHQYKRAVIKGIGMLVGAEMLFDTLHAPDYPLDSGIGEKFDSSLKEAFFEGVGSGFAETLCRFWRMLLLPKDMTSPLYAKMLDIEWERCHILMSRMSPAYYFLIEKGFLHDLKSRHFTPGIQNYLNNKFSRHLQKGDVSQIQGSQKS
jgi:hypothetical protein